MKWLQHQMELSNNQMKHINIRWNTKLKDRMVDFATDQTTCNKKAHRTWNG